MAISNEGAAEVYREGAKVIRAQQEEITRLQEKVAAYERRERVEGLVRLMEGKGLDDPGSTFQEKVAHVMASSTDLDVLEKAVQMAQPGSTLQWSTVDSDEGDSANFGYGSRFEQFLVEG